MKIAICGCGESGKDTAANFLAAASGLRFHTSSSQFGARLVFERWGKDHYKTVEDCFADRRKFREIWRDIIADYNREDPARMYREMLADQDILVRVCRRADLEAIKKAELVDLWIWIERSGMPLAVDTTQEFGGEECNITIPNDGSIDMLRVRMQALAEAIRMGDLLRFRGLSTRLNEMKNGFLEA